MFVRNNYPSTLEHLISSHLTSKEHSDFSMPSIKVLLQLIQVLLFDRKFDKVYNISGVPQGSVLAPVVFACNSAVDTF